MVKSGEDRLISAWTVSAGGAILGLPILIWTGLPSNEVMPLVVASAFVQTFYMLSLARSYQAGDLAFVYPVARGVSPVLISVLGVALLDDEIGPLGAVGVAVVTAALVVLAVSRTRRDGLGWALMTGAAISSYTLLDAAASRANGSAIPVVMAMFVLHGVFLSLIVIRRRGVKAVNAHIRQAPGRAGFGGVAGTASYVMVVSATMLAPVGLVSAVRETSVVLGVIAGKKVLGETVSPRHLVVVLVAATGALLIALS